MKKILLFAACVGLITSCTTDDYGSLVDGQDCTMPKTGYALSTKNHTAVQVDSTTFFGADFSSCDSLSNLTRAVNGITPLAAGDRVEMKGYGYDEITKIKDNTKMAFSSSSKVLLSVGLPSGIYIIRVYMVSKVLSTYSPGNDIVPLAPDEKLKDMGTKTPNPWYDNAVKGWTSMEDTESGDGVFEGVTYLLYFVSDLSGQSLKRYYPCSPEALVWNYRCYIN